MKLRHILLAILSGALFMIALGTVLPAQTRLQPTSAQQASDKYDGDCTGTETAGRCADKPLVTEPVAPPAPPTPEQQPEIVNQCGVGK